MIANGVLSPPIFLRGKSGRGRSFKAELSKPCAWEVPIPHPLFLKTFMGRRRKANPSCPLALVPCPLSLGAVWAPRGHRPVPPAPTEPPAPAPKGHRGTPKPPSWGGGTHGDKDGDRAGPCRGCRGEEDEGSKKDPGWFWGCCSSGEPWGLHGAVFGPQNRGVPASPGGSREGAAGSSGWGEGKDARPSLRTS